MATHSVTTFIDDINGETADTTVEFSLDGVYYEIDLTAKNADALRSDIAVFIQSGRRIKGLPGTHRRRPHRPRPRLAHTPPVNAALDADQAWTKKDRTAMRAWGVKNGFPGIKPQGRVPRELVSRWVSAGAPR